jgi:hypothetical protein
MRGAGEGVDDVLTLDPLVPVAPVRGASVKGAPKERLWSLDKEQVGVKVLSGSSSLSKEVWLNSKEV